MDVPDPVSQKRLDDAARNTALDETLVQGTPLSPGRAPEAGDLDGGGRCHIGFFFRGRNIYAFDCISPAAQLTQVDRQDFQPLLASVRIG